MGNLGREIGSWIGYWTGNLRFGKNWNGWKKLKRCRCVYAPIVKDNRIAGEVTELEAIQKPSHRNHESRDGLLIEFGCRRW
jgi:hypothetical protein